MAEVNSIREFHSELSSVLSSLEVIASLVSRDYEDIEPAFRPSLLRFRQLLDAGDQIAGPQDFPI